MTQATGQSERTVGLRLGVQRLGPETFCKQVSGWLGVSTSQMSLHSLRWDIKEVGHESRRAPLGQAALENKKGLRRTGWMGQPELRKNPTSSEQRVISG